MSFGQSVLDLLVFVSGGTLFIGLSITSILCGLAGLLTLSDENRPLFKVFSRTISGFMLFFGGMLLFRPVSILGFVLAVWWALIICEVSVAYRIVQFGFAIILSFIFWVRQIWYSREFFLVKIGDFSIFVIVPFVVVLVLLSRGSDRLGGVNSESASVAIPLRKILGMLAECASMIFPDYGTR